ncbi:hypothetical protein DFH07DRAFT_964526 [Mycena maculata]|uniref:Uncharacterized protein n=1 Tax=Mycena maculata TaxID=230809 RepID=A0AAD7II83_9AGAR|nr:hypothetical protein DFH07DRAFT_964526 [Mycena maculata]
MNLLQEYWRLQDHEEPVLTEYDPKAAVEREVLAEDEDIQRRARIDVLNQRIRRWLAYRARKVYKHRQSSGRKPTKDLFAVLLAKLSGLKAPPKVRQAFQQYMSESYEEKIRPAIEAQWDEARDKDPQKYTTKAPKAGFRAQVARQIFKELPEAERKAIGDRATAEGKATREKYEKALTEPPSRDPARMQECIDAIPDFMGPILSGIQDYTGLHLVLVLGGPMPKHGGDLRTVHVSAGRSNTSATHHFAQYDRPCFNRDVLEFMKEYLHKTFSPAECSAVSMVTTDLAGAKYTISQGGSDIAHATGSSPAEVVSAKGKKKAAAADTDSASDSDSSDLDSESESDSDDSESDSGDDEEQPKRKKRKVQEQKGKKNATPSTLIAPIPPTLSTPTAPVAPISPPPAQPVAPPTYMEEREMNRAKNHALAKEMFGDDTRLFALPVVNTPATKRRRPKKRDGEPAAAPRKSTRLAPKNPGTAPTAPSPTPVDTPRLTTPTTPTHTPTPTTPTPAPTPSPAVPSHTSTPAAMTSTSSPPAPPPYPPKALPWFVNAHAQVTRVHLGPHFNAVVAAWIRVEASSRYEQGPTNLPNKSRPQQVTAWIGSGRSARGCDTSVPNPEAYAVTWQKWWDSLQPAWRERTGDGTWAVTAGYGTNGKEWGSLYHWGVNGTLSHL